MELDRLIGDPLPRLDGGVLGETHLGDQVGLASGVAAGDVPDVHPGDVDAWRTLDADCYMTLSDRARSAPIALRTALPHNEISTTGVDAEGCWARDGCHTPSVPW